MQQNDIFFKSILDRQAKTEISIAYQEVEIQGQPSTKDSELDKNLLTLNFKDVGLYFGDSINERYSSIAKISISPKYPDRNNFVGYSHQTIALYCVRPLLPINTPVL